MRASVLLLPTLLLLAAAPAAADPPVVAPNALFVDAGGAAHAARFSYAGPCDGAGTTTVTLLDSGATLTASVQSKAIGNTCGSSISCLDCPPVPEAYAWELTGQGVVLVGGGPSYYYAYGSHPLAYSLSGQYLDGVLTAWGIAPL